MLISCLCWTTSTVTSLYFLKELPQTVQRSLSSMLPLASLMAELVVSRVWGLRLCASLVYEGLTQVFRLKLMMRAVAISPK